MFNDVESPATHSLDAFKYILNTYCYENRDSVSWYKCPCLPEVLNLIGYRTIWISNQSQNGIMDSIAGAYSDLCSEEYYTREGWNTYDQDVLQLIEPVCKESNSVFFVHLLGSHPDFRQRYPG